MGEGVHSSICKVVVLIFFLCSGVRGTSDTEAKQRDELYAEALKLRSQVDAKPRNLERAGRLLLEAAGIKAEQVKPPNVVSSNITDHPGILRELAKALERGVGVPKNLVLSLQFFRRAAELGDAEAHGEMGIRSSFGLHSDSTVSWSKLVSKFVKADIPGAILHYTYGAQGNDTVSEMTLGFRHMFGFGVPKNCPTAVSYYNAVAEKVIALGQSPGKLPSIERVRLSIRALQGSRKSKEEHMLQYYQYSADLGDVEAQTAIGQVFTYGSHGIPQDHQLALHYFSQAAQAGDSGAMSHLGHMYANGLGVKQDNGTALQWFEKGATKGHKNAHFGLGYMYLSGYGVRQNHHKAFHHFSKAADMDHTDAQFHLGVMYLKGLHVAASPMRAKVFFGAASHSGHLLGMYNLAMMYLSGSGAEPNCYSALKLLKQVAERGPWSKILQEGHKSFSKGDYSHAALLYLRAGQMGLELGQNNAAWMLEHNFLPKLEPDSIKIALDLYKSSAAQDMQVSTTSLLAIGDIYFYGRGIPKNWNQSAAVYRHAEHQKSSRGAFNLGFMYEFGAGLPKDVQMAKRYYERSYEYNEDAFYAAKLATTFLAVHVWWDSLRDVIPSWLGFLGDQLFTLKYADQNSVPHGWWSGRRADYLSDPQNGGIVGKIMRLLDFDVVGEFFQDAFAIYSEDDVGELLETLVLGVLIVIFLLMFWRRQNNNRQVVDRNHVPAPPRAHVPPVPPATPVEGNNVQATPQAESGGSPPTQTPNPSTPLPPESSSRSPVEPRIPTPPTPRAQTESLPSSQSSLAGGETSGAPQDG